MTPHNFCLTFERPGMMPSHVFLYGWILITTFGCVMSTVPSVTTDATHGFITAPEDIAINSPLLVIHITDPDDHESIHIRPDDLVTASLVMLDVYPDEARTPPLTVTVRVRRPLDRDPPSSSSYNLKFRVTDSSSNMVMISIALYLIDTNDNAPSFQNPGYTWDIHEDATVGATFPDIKATDIDNGDSSAVVYSMTPETKSNSVANEYDATFGIDPTSGDVTLKKSLDYARNSYYQFTITAKDRGTPPLSSTAVFVIRVLNVHGTPLTGVITGRK